MFYVTPAVNATSSSTHCPQPCHTLHYYAANSSTLLSQTENTQLVFLEGEHFLHNNLLFSMENITNLSMIGYSTAIPSLYIANGSFIQATNISFLTVQNLKIIGNFKYLEFPNYFQEQEVNIRGFILAQLRYVQILNGNIEMHGKRLVVDQSSLSGSILTRSQNGHQNTHTSLLNTTYMVYSHLALAKGNTASLILVHCNVTSHPYIPSIDTTFMKDNKHIHIEMKKTHYRGKIALNVNSNPTETVIFRAKNCTFESVPMIPYIADRPNLLELQVNVLGDSLRTIHLAINDTKFYGKIWTCVYINVPAASGDKINVSISHSNLTSFGQTMVAVKERNKNFISATLLTIQLNKVIVFASTRNFPAIKLGNVDQVLLKDSKFINNKVTAIEVHSSVIAFYGAVVFKNNTGFKGGALSLYSSQLYFYDNSDVYFEDNTATGVGGAIYTKSQDNIEAPCLYIRDSRARNVNVWFSNNWANMGGHDIFGGYLNNSCRYWEHENKQCYMYIPRNLNHDDTYKFHTGNSLSSPTAVTCNPTRVCLCDEHGAPQCANRTFIHRKLPPLYPGETLAVSAVLVGCAFGTVSGIVYTKVTNEQGETLTQTTQQIRSLDTCTPLHYTLHSPRVGRTINITLSARLFPRPTRIECLRTETIRTYHKYGVIRDKLLHQNVYLQLTMDDCPPGFVLRKKPPRVCSCHPRLKERGIRVCTIQNHTGYVYRKGATWVSLTENKTDFILNQYCPYNYCLLENISIDLNSPNNQCQNNRSGILCGGCHGNLSLAIGSSKCLRCEKKHSGYLIVPFLVVGILLVIFLKTLDMTVSNGTINGLALYANVVWGSKSVLLATKLPHPTLQILHTFIAWLNFDLGIETCFITGLDAIGKTWLQYVFPVYVWCIAGAIALVSRYSTRASRVFGYNSVPVLATLILLSYAKLLRNVIQSLSLSIIQYPQHWKLVWTPDGNIEYFSSQHSILFLTAVIILLLLWLPFTLVLLTHQHLRRKSHLKYLNWINRWKPFFDAYLGQLKAKQQYWVGLLLIVRVVLLLLLAATSTSVPRINLIATGFLGVGLLTHWAVRGMPYRSKWLSLLEMTFILNLVLLAYLKLYTESDTVADMVVTYTSVGVVFVQFLGIVVYHVTVRLRTLYRQRRRQRVINTHTELATMPTTTRSFYREPLLDS